MQLAATLLRKVAAVPGRPEKGRWVRTIPRPAGDAPRVGVVSPDGWFPVMYATEEPKGGATEALEFLRDEDTVIVMVLDVELERVLDLSNARTRARLDLTVREITRTGGILSDVQDAAFRSGFDGVIYPRPLRPRRRNLCIFVDCVETEVTGTFGPYSTAG